MDGLTIQGITTKNDTLMLVALLNEMFYELTIDEDLIQNDSDSRDSIKFTIYNHKTKKYNLNEGQIKEIFDNIIQTFNNCIKENWNDENVSFKINYDFASKKEAIEKYENYKCDYIFYVSTINKWCILTICFTIRRNEK